VVEWLRGRKALPYTFSHEQPAEAMARVNRTFSSCAVSEDCTMFLNAWVKGASGFVYTQTGLQNSYQATRNRTKRLKFYEERRVALPPGFPAFCDFIESFGVTRRGLKVIQEEVAVIAADESIGFQAIQTFNQQSLKVRDS
jgi:hypothetical protein